MERPPDTYRTAVRALILSPNREVLLMRIHAPQGGKSFWIAPGGGLDLGEDMESGLRRELREELDLSKFACGPLVWRRRHSFDWEERRICQSESFFIVETERFEPRISDEVEAAYLEEFRWCAIEELDLLTDSVVPASLKKILVDFLRLGPPANEPEVEILVD